MSKLVLMNNLKSIPLIKSECTRHLGIKVAVRTVDRDKLSLPETESKFLVELIGYLLRRCQGAGESVGRKACFLACSSCEQFKPAFCQKCKGTWGKNYLSSPFPLF